MKEFYKLYIGESVAKGMPENCTSYGIVTHETLVPKVKYLFKTLQEGQDLLLSRGDFFNTYHVFFS